MVKAHEEQLAITTMYLMQVGQSLMVTPYALYREHPILWIGFTAARGDLYARLSASHIYLYAAPTADPSTNTLERLELKRHAMHTRELGGISVLERCPADFMDNVQHQSTMPERSRRNCGSGPLHA
jgi:hypothetical protein